MYFPVVVCLPSVMTTANYDRIGNYLSFSVLNWLQKIYLSMGTQDVLELSSEVDVI